MTTSSLALRRDYLDGQRRLIIARAIVGSLSGLVPVPFLDDYVKASVLGGGYRRIAEAHGVDVHEQALKNLVHGKTPPPSLVELAASNVVFKIANVAAKRMMVALATVNRARAASHTFMTMTLFDHYCARLHTGGALDGATSLALREEIGKAIEQTPGALGLHPFRRGVLTAIRATVKAPLELADLATGGFVRRLLAKRSSASEITEPEAVEELEQTLQTALADKSSFLSRTVAAVELQLTADGNPYVDAAIEALDRRWRARVAAGLS